MMLINNNTHSNGTKRSSSFIRLLGLYYASG